MERAQTENLMNSKTDKAQNTRVYQTTFSSFILHSRKEERSRSISLPCVSRSVPRVHPFLLYTCHSPKSLKGKHDDQPAAFTCLSSVFFVFHFIALPQIQLILTPFFSQAKFNAVKSGVGNPHSDGQKFEKIASARKTKNLDHIEPKRKQPRKISKTPSIEPTMASIENPTSGCCLPVECEFFLNTLTGVHSTHNSYH